MLSRAGVTRERTNATNLGKLGLRQVEGRHARVRECRRGSGCAPLRPMRRRSRSTLPMAGARSPPMPSAPWQPPQRTSKRCRPAASESAPPVKTSVPKFSGTWFGSRLTTQVGCQQRKCGAAIRRRAFDAIEVGAPFRAGLDGGTADRAQRDARGGIPDVGGFVDARGSGPPGAPGLSRSFHDRGRWPDRSNRRWARFRIRDSGGCWSNRRPGTFRPRRGPRAYCEGPRPVRHLAPAGRHSILCTGN